MTTFPLPESWEAMPYGGHWSFAYDRNGRAREDYDFRVEFDGTVGETEQAAVVRLLEAAPELLEACNALLAGVAECRVNGKMHEAVKLAGIAIAKVRGENAGSAV